MGKAENVRILLNMKKQDSQKSSLNAPTFKFETLQDLDKDIIVFDENPIAMFKSKIIIKPIDIQFSRIL